MNDRDEKMALWIAFTVKEFGEDEINLLCNTLKSKLGEIKGIVND